MSTLLKRGVFSAGLSSGPSTFAASTATLNGTSQKFTYATGTAQGEADYSVTIRFKIADVTIGAAEMRMFNEIATSSTQFTITYGSSLTGLTDGKISVGVRSSGGTFLQTSSTFTPAVDTWYDMTAVCSGGTTVKIYVDGALDTTNSVAYTTIGNTSTNTHIIGGFTSSLFFDGDIAFVIPHNAALDLAEVQSLSSAGSPLCWGDLPAGIQTNALAFWDLANWTGHTGQEITDQAGSNDLTNIASTPFIGTGLNVVCN